MDKYTAQEQAFKRGYEKGYEDGRRTALECVLLGKWIPVNKMLPGGDEVVLCYKADGKVRLGTLLDATYVNGVQAFIDRERNFAFGATHWMPLPKLPKECE